MASLGRLRWGMLALMLTGTIVIYVDRNVLGVLAPILKKDLNFTNNVELNVYLRYEDESLVEALNFKHIHERYHSDSYKFVIGKINLQNLIDNEEQIAASKAFIAFADQLAGVSLAPEVKLVAEVVE